MIAATNNEPRLVSSRVIHECISAELSDRRTSSVPRAWSWRLSDAAPEQRNHFEIPGGGETIRWPDINEDISVRAVLGGDPARNPKNVTP